MHMYVSPSQYITERQNQHIDNETRVKLRKAMNIPFVEISDSNNFERMVQRAALLRRSENPQ